MDNNMPDMDPNMYGQPSEKKKFPMWIVIVSSVLGGVGIVLVILFVLGVNIFTLPSMKGGEFVQMIDESLQHMDLGEYQDTNEIPDESKLEDEVFERGEDSFGTFVRAAENAPKDYSDMFLDVPILVDWYPHAARVAEVPADRIFASVNPNYATDKLELKTFVSESTLTGNDAGAYKLYLYQVGAIASPSLLAGKPLYIMSYPIDGMGATIDTRYVVYVDELQKFLVLNSESWLMDQPFYSSIIDIGDYIGGTAHFDKGFPDYDKEIFISNTDSVLISTGIYSEEYGFVYWGARDNAGGIANIIDGNIVQGYPNSAIAFTDDTYGPLYFVDNEYRAIAKDGSVHTYELLPSFLSKPSDAEEKKMYTVGYTADVTWNPDFSQSTNIYMIGGEMQTQGCGAGIKKQTNIVNNAIWFDSNALTQVGTAKNGDAIFVMIDAKNSSIYKDLFDFGGDAAYMQAHPDVDYQDLETVPEQTRYAEFLDNDPIIFWKDHKDRWRMYFKSEYQSLAECGKPVIYLYPEQAMDVNVQVAPNGGFTYTDPVYPEKGWFVHATPKGELYSYNEKANYPYLFWEGHADGFGFSDNGFVFSRKTLESDMIDLLAKTGLNKQETADFLEFWLPKMEEKPYVFVTFANQRAFESVAPLTVTPRPDSVLRVFMSFEPLDAYKKVEPLALTGFERKGFTVVEWGGVLEKK